MKRIHIKKHEVGLWYRHGDLHRVLDPGRYWIPGRVFGRDEIEIVNTLESIFEPDDLDLLLLNQGLKDRLHIVDLDDDEQALVWKNGTIEWFLCPGRHAFWRTPYTIEIGVFDLDGFELRVEILE